MQVKYLEMKQKYDEMNEKMQFLSKVSGLKFISLFIYFFYLIINLTYKNEYKRRAT